MAAEVEIGDGARPDVVAWLNEPASDLGAALLVETKATIRDARRTEESVNQVARYMSAAGIRTGLLLALDADDEIKVRIVPAGYVFITSPNTLLALSLVANLRRALLKPETVLFTRALELPWATFPIGGCIRLSVKAIWPRAPTQKGRRWKTFSPTCLRNFLE